MLKLLSCTWLFNSGIELIFWFSFIVLFTSFSVIGGISIVFSNSFSLDDSCSSKSKFNTSISELFSSTLLRDGIFTSCFSSELLFNILLISSSVFLTVILSLIILFNISTCLFLSNFNNDLACLSEIFSFNNASWTSSSKFNNLSLFAIVDCVLPNFSAKSVWFI